MVVILIFWILVSLAFFGWGKLSTTILGPKVILEDFSETGHFFLGLSVVGILSGIYWCLFPINQVFGGCILGIGIGYGLSSFPIKLHIQFKSIWFIAACLLFGLAVLMKSAAPTSYFDCGLYYIQSVRWAQNFPVIPGLGNLHVRLGTISSWHLLTAAFDWQSISRGNLDDLGELVLLWFLVFHSWNSIKRTGFERYLSLCLIFSALWLSYPLLTAPSPDLATGLIGMQTLFQFRKFLKAWDPKMPNQLNTRGLALFIQSLFLAQIKLSAMPFLLVSFLILFLIMRKGWFISSFHLVVFGLLVGTTMVYRSYVLSGYALFPAFQGGLVSDWKIPKDQVVEYLEGVRGFARHRLSLSELQSGITYESIGRMSFFEWFPIWAKDRTLEEWVIILLAVSGWLLLVRFVSGHIRRSFKDHWPLIFFTWLSGMMLLFWFSNAPDVRFGMAILGMGFSYSMAAIILNLSNRFSWIAEIGFQRIVLSTLSFGALISYVDMRSIRQNLLFPPNYPENSILNYQNEQGHPMYAPNEEFDGFNQSGQCWDGPLPCSQKPLPHLKWRGNSLKEGFRYSTELNSGK
jgi:hypothetical protein